MSIITDKTIRDKCVISTTYGRGRDLFENDAVFSLLLKKVATDCVQFIGEVEGSTGNIYNTLVRIEYKENRKDFRIESASCECKAFRKYNGFCKHLVATLMEANFCVDKYEVRNLLEKGSIGDSYDVLEAEYDEEEMSDEAEVEFDSPQFPAFLEEDMFDVPSNNNNDITTNKPQSSNKWQEYLDELLNKGTVSKGMKINESVTASGRTFSYYEEPKKPESSRKLLDAISGVVLQERNQFCQQIAGGDVSLEVTLHLDFNGERIEFRIGKTQMYVVKNIDELIDNIRKQQFVMYGKKLEFVHTQSAFTKESLELVSFLLDTPPRKQEYQYGYTAVDRRYFTLDERMLDKFLNLFEGKSLKVETCISYDTRLTPVKRQNPKLPVTLSGRKGGREVLVIFPEILLLEGNDRFAIWWEDCVYLCTEDFCKDMKEIMKLCAVNELRSERHNSNYYRFVKQVEPFLLCENDYASFVTTLLPVLEKHMDVTISDIDFTKYQIEDGRYELYFDLTKEQNVVCRAKAIYGDKEHNLIDLAALDETYRDIKIEYEIRTLLEQYFPNKSSNNELYLLKNDDDRLADLVEHGVSYLENLCEVFVSDAFKQIRIATAVNVNTGLSIKGNLLKLTWDVNGMSKEELYEILSAYRKKKKYYRLHDGELLNLSDAGIGILSDMQEDLHLSKTQLKAGMAEIPMYRALYLNALMRENADRIKVERTEKFDQLISNFEEIKQREYKLPKEINANLRNYQIEGYKWACALAQMGFGGILADDMGLGKTLQMIAYLRSVKGGTHLVICPASLVYNWEAEFDKFAPDMRICSVVGTALDREKILEDWHYYDVLITSYDLLKRDIDFYVGKSFGCEIIDEAQYIKNPATQAAKAVKAIESRNRFALTGTPIENRLSELWSIFEYLMPGYLYSYKYFKETFEEKIVQSTEEEKLAIERLHRMIAPFLMRRLKKDVLKDLPDKIEEVVYTKFDKEQDKLYKAAEKNIIMNLKQKSGREVKENKLQILAELTRLRQICCDPSLLYENYKGDSAKLDTCMELLENAIEGGHRILVFSQFTTMLDVIQKQLRKRNISFFTLTGSTTKAKRRDLVEQFQNGRAQVFLISLKAGGTGLNLTAADMVIHYDPWWNVAAQNQATDRTHRIGQEKDVTVVKLIAKDTIEERILKLQEKKQDLADKIISAEGVSISALSKDDILALFEG